MGSAVIAVDNLSKRYQIGHQRSKDDGFRHVVENALRAPIKWMLGRREQRRRLKEEFWALRDVSFDIHKGDVVGIIGRNGAGKSTLLKILSRITEPTNGRIAINGRVASLLEVGTGFHPELTGRENIFLNGAILGMSKAEIKSKFDEIVAFSEIEKFLDTPVKRYSSGMYVRLAFAVAAHLEPEILIVDEVLAVGDTQFQQKCLGKMNEVARVGRTVLFVSHNLSAVRSLCGRGIVFQGGRKVYEGTGVEATNHYSSMNGGEVGASWVRDKTAASLAMRFEKVGVSLIGRQPLHTLLVDIELSCQSRCEDSFVAVDICDSAFAAIMQAVPTSQKFIKGEPGRQRFRFEVDLPPLVPGTYFVDLWVGSHFSRTLDSLKGVVRFEITESPTKGRSFPHTPDHGLIVPESRLVSCA